jgi:predicted nucleic acid-binding protein
MPILDTSLVIERVKNTTEVTVIEFPPILKYHRFFGKIYLVEREDFEFALKLQIELRKIGLPKALSDLLIASICINRNEELITRDSDFLDIAKVSNLKIKLVD